MPNILSIYFIVIFEKIQNNTKFLAKNIIQVKTRKY